MVYKCINTYYIYTPILYTHVYKKKKNYINNKWRVYLWKKKSQKMVGIWIIKGHDVIKLYVHIQHNFDKKKYFFKENKIYSEIYVHIYLYDI